MIGCMTENCVEIWLDIPEFDGLYQASTLGRIRSLDKIVNYPRGMRGFALRRGRVLKPKLSHNGYYEVVLISESGHRCTRKVHRLVAETFQDNPENLPYVNHIDGDKLNNRPINLEWCTPRYNSEEYTKKRCSFSQYDLRGNLIRDWNSMTRAAESVQGDKSGIYHCCSGRLKSYKGFIWKYKQNH